MSAATFTAWHRKVQYRHDCDECHERKMCAVIQRRGGRSTLRLCEPCYADGHWRKRP